MDFNSVEVWVPLMVVLLLVVFGALLYYYLRIYVLSPSGKGAWKHTRRTMKRFGLLRGCKVLDHVPLESEGEVLEVETMLVGRFGILMAKTLGLRGAYYGMPGEDKWSLVQKDDRKQAMENPLREQERATAALRAIFAGHGIYKVPVEQVVVFADRSPKTEVHITNDGRLLLPRKLRGFLSHSRFEREAGVDVEKIADLLGSLKNKP